MMLPLSIALSKLAELEYPKKNAQTYQTEVVYPILSQCTNLAKHQSVVLSAATKATRITAKHTNAAPVPTPTAANLSLAEQGRASGMRRDWSTLGVQSYMTSNL